jgi:hypothetical protein
MKRISLILAFVSLLPMVSISDTAIKEISSKQILADGPDWQENYDRFQPASGMIEALRSKLGDDLKIDVYLGLWCPDSKNNVPPFLKILDQLNASIPVRYFSVHRKPIREIRYFVDSAKVERVPTFIFFREGKEIGRIVENPKAGLMEDMMEIVTH